jgi:hypothetical protein
MSEAETMPPVLAIGSGIGEKAEVTLTLPTRLTQFGSRDSHKQCTVAMHCGCDWFDRNKTQVRLS